MHKPLLIRDLGLYFPKKICFEDFSTDILPFSRIAIIGKNGIGKSSLLNILRGALLPSEGELMVTNDVHIGYVGQTILDYPMLSGAQRFNKQLTKVLAETPNLLLLDEPTNHLDRSNRKSLMRMLNNFYGTVVVVSHDIELLSSCIDIFWDIDNGTVHQFTGSYDDYYREKQQLQNTLERELTSLKNEKHEAHAKLMKEQKRSANSKAKGQKSIRNKKWPTVVSSAKANRAGETAGKKKSAIDQAKHAVMQKMSSLKQPKVIKPKFSLDYQIKGTGPVLSITSADIGYKKGCNILKNINLSVAAKQRVAVIGDNGSGKSTLLKAILGDQMLCRTGEWYTPNIHRIGYVDQHYANLVNDISVLDNLKQIRPEWCEADLRKHLNDFLFRKNEEVFCLTNTLSGGERARLSLCLLSANVPKLLILDEITNNLDLETKQHVIQVLQDYPGAMILVSHDAVFLKEVVCDQTYCIKNASLKAVS